MVIENLILNAVDAMPEGGTISISSKKEDPHICVTMTDTGIGMDDQTRRRLFEPFFTTKKLVGTGLSLSTVYSTITHWGGHIEVESAPGKGTTFFLSLPIWDQTTAYPFLPDENA
jgi:signal transduction histidine kinase